MSSHRTPTCLAPAYYLAPGLTEEMVFARARAILPGARRAWIAGDPLPGYQELIQRLRKRGVAGPLWSYVSTVQRLWQPTPVPSK